MKFEIGFEIGFALIWGSQIWFGIGFALGLSSEICFENGFALNYGGAVLCLPGPVPASAWGALPCSWPDHLHQTELPQIGFPCLLCSPVKRSGDHPLSMSDMLWMHVVVYLLTFSSCAMACPAPAQMPLVTTILWGPSPGLEAAWTHRSPGSSTIKNTHVPGRDSK